MKSKIYQLYELRDEIKKAIANLDSVELSEKELAAIVAESGKGEKFKEFSQGLQDNWKNYEQNRMTLRTRLKRIERVISIYEGKGEQGKLAEEIVTCVLEAIGAAVAEKEEEAKA